MRADHSSPRCAVIPMLSIILAASGAEVMAATECIRNGMKCYWWGGAPYCGNTAFFVGDLDKELMQLIMWTKVQDITTLCENTGVALNPGSDCCERYGSGCWNGYKRLWCEAPGASKCMKKG